jgi:hypothetical protein
MAPVSNAEKLTLREMRGQNKLNALLSTPIFYALIFFFIFCFSLIYIKTFHYAVYSALAVGFLIGVLTTWKL